MIHVAIEGIDGTGKTTVAKALQKELAEEGTPACVFAPYRMADKRSPGGLYWLWELGGTAAKGAIDTLHGVFADCEAEAKAAGAEVVIYDRHWMTAFTEIDRRPELVKYWGNHFVSAALLVADPFTATCRTDSDGAWAELSEQKHYDQAYRGLVGNYFQHVLGVYRSDKDVTPQAIAHAINCDLRIRR